MGPRSRAAAGITRPLRAHDRIPASCARHLRFAHRLRRTDPAPAISAVGISLILPIRCALFLGAHANLARVRLGCSLLSGYAPPTSRKLEERFPSFLREKFGEEVLVLEERA